MIYVYILIAVSVVLLLLYFKSGSQVESKMKGYSNNAVLDAKENHRQELDLSKESLEQVNLIIQKLHFQRDKNIKELSMLYGGYIGEVIIGQVENAVWFQEKSIFGKKDAAVKIKEGDYVFPVEWVSEHLSNGEDDNILYKFITWKHSHNR